MEDPFSNEDVTLEVLSRLSTKDLCASKCVSKRWNFLISNPSFLRMHYYSQRSKEISGFFIQDSFGSKMPFYIRPVTYIRPGKGYPEMPKTPLEFLPEKVILMASCNGLLCCQYQRKSPSKELVIYLCNPTTEEWIAILRPTGCRVFDRIGLAFYPFGSSSNSKNSAPSFKLVSIQRSNNGQNTYYSFVVYSSETRRWTTSKQVFHCNYEIIYKNRELFIGQRFHWLTMNHHIITFDVERELSGVIKLPGPVMIKENRTCIGGSKEYLHYVCVDSTELKVWMLKDYSNPEWVLKYHLTVSEFCREHYAKLSSDTLDLLARKVYSGDIFTNNLLLPQAFYEDVLFMYLDGWSYLYNFKTRSLEKHFPSSIRPTVLPYSVCLAAMGVLKESIEEKEGLKEV